jgi:signal transduction histidine kinase
VFKAAYLKLTFFYVLIAMIISVSFSVAIYRISTNEIGRNLGPQSRIFRNFTPDDFENLRNQQIEESNTNLKVNLFYYNLAIFVLSLFGSYFLARRTLRPIEDTMEAQNRFTADASHELRTPLAAMKAEIEVALRDKKMKIAESKKLLQSNLEEIEKLEKLSSALLKITRIQEEKKNFTSIALDEAVIEAFEKVEKLATKKEIEFENILIHAKILGDHQSLVELFVILLDNAIKYSREKSKINILMQKARHHVIVKIKDHGIGIKQSDIPYIFNRFYRADSSRSKEQISGYGLGLAIAQQIVDLHGGKISVESKPGKGSEFIVRFNS